MNKALILNRIINELFNGSKSDFARKLDVKPQTISSWIARNTFDIELIFAKCDNLSAEFLLTGEGSMLKTSEKGVETASESGSNGTIEALKGIIKEQATEIATLRLMIQQMQAPPMGVQEAFTA